MNNWNSVEYRDYDDYFWSQLDKYEEEEEWY